jgi:protein SCO1/2
MFCSKTLSAIGRRLSARRDALVPHRSWRSQVFLPTTESRQPTAARFLAVIGLLLITLPALAQRMTGPPSVPAQTLPPQLGAVNFEQKLDAQIPLDATFQNEFGQTVKLNDYFHQGKPVILNLVYYDCPMLCTEVLNGLSGTMCMMKFDLGKEYDVLTVSIDPREKPELAAAKKRAYLQRYGHPDAQNYWHFLTGDEKNIRALTDAVGFHYEWDPKMQQYAHATGIVVLTPEGRVSKYFYGVEYSPKDLRLGLVDASQNRIGSVVDQVLLYCYHYDPRTGKYGAVITRVLQLAGAVTVIILGGLLIFLFRHEPRKQPSAVGSRPSASSDATTAEADEHVLAEDRRPTADDSREHVPADDRQPTTDSRKV